MLLESGAEDRRRRDVSLVERGLRVLAIEPTPAMAAPARKRPSDTTCRKRAAIAVVLV